MWTRTIHQSFRGGFGKLEILFVLAFLSLLFQVFPSLWFGLLRIADVRYWPGWVWLTLNVAVVVGLFTLRLAPQLYADWQASRARRKADFEKNEKQRKLKLEKELLERMKEARKRRVY